MSDVEAVAMLTRCKSEIETLRTQINYLRPRAEAYEVLAKVLSLLPNRGEAGSENIIYTIEKRIRELTPEGAPPNATP